MDIIGLQHSDLDESGKGIDMENACILTIVNSIRSLSKVVKCRSDRCLFAANLLLILISFCSGAHACGVELVNVEKGKYDSKSHGQEIFLSIDCPSDMRIRVKIYDFNTVLHNEQYKIKKGMNKLKVIVPIKETSYESIWKIQIKKWSTNYYYVSYDSKEHAFLIANYLNIIKGYYEQQVILGDYDAFMEKYYDNSKDINSLLSKQSIAMMPELTRNDIKNQIFIEKRKINRARRQEHREKAFHAALIGETIILFAVILFFSLRQYKNVKGNLQT